jgi:hypothetical protein
MKKCKCLIYADEQLLTISIPDIFVIAIGRTKYVTPYKSEIFNLYKLTQDYEKKYKYAEK